jgi:tRNA pseudouridine-54 N-methylase
VTRRFLVAFEKLDIDAASVKSGHNSRNVVVACRCVNVGLFLSGNLRRDVEVSLLIGTSEDLNVIKFRGSTLKRVSPDERSIAFFLLKAHNILDTMQRSDKRIMDNGIILQRMTLKEMFDSWSVETCYVANQEFNTTSDYSTISKDGCFLYDMIPARLEVECVTKALPRPPHPERFILEINHTCDKQS